MSTPARELPDRSNRSDRSARSTTRKRLRPAGGYRTTASFQTATLIYDATYWFCEKFLDPRSRLAEQMLMAARSGRQNIAEGSRFAATSSQTELRLLNAARSSLEELLLDYEDFLFHRHLPQWSPDSAEARAVRAVAAQLRRDPSDPSDRSDPSDPQAQRRALHALYARWLEHADPAVRANAIICLIHQANYLLDQQLTALEQAFIEEGGYSEQLATARLQRRSRRNPSDPSDRSDQSDQSDPIPQCPRCGKPMALRTAKTGPHAGRQFWGCTAYPDCKGTAEL
jgi:four helix bundle suffix protein